MTQDIDGFSALRWAKLLKHENIANLIRPLVLKRSIEEQRRVTDLAEIKILDGKDPGSYARDFAAYAIEQRKAARKSEVVGPEDEPVGPGG